MKISFYIIFGVFLVMMTGCTSYQSLLNYNEPPGIPKVPQEINNFEALKIQSSDLLRISVSSLDMASTQPFKPGGGSDQEGAQNTYLVSSGGYITFPTVGKIQVEGLNIEEVQDVILEKLKPYFQDEPIIQARLENFKVNVNGEVGQPGTYSVNNDRLSIIEAVTLAGDFTAYSRRDSILIIREENGMRSFGYVNFNSADIFNSDLFYLKQNDVIYVQPDKTIVNSVRDPAQRILPWITAAVSLLALSFSISR